MSYNKDETKELVKYICDICGCDITEFTGRASLYYAYTKFMQYILAHHDFCDKCYFILIESISELKKKYGAVDA